MATEPQWDPDLAPEETGETSETVSHISTYAGRLGDVTGARLAAETYLRALALVSPPSTAERWDDVLLVVTELAANAVQYAPGPFRLELRRTFDGDGVHVLLHDTSTTLPAPRSFRPSGGGGGVGWHLIRALSDEVGAVAGPDGKDVHVFLPW
ncbi:ATP-binding protein [Streptomyces sp. NPDC059786]|uniref:ATP-binding protein n=1 Tax=Streptomyces sp. NPDC059786 TaxID=3346946 RepID=UPI003647B4F6